MPLPRRIQSSPTGNSAQSAIQQDTTIHTAAHSSNGATAPNQQPSLTSQSQEGVHVPPSTQDALGALYMTKPPARRAQFGNLYVKNNDGVAEENAIKDKLRFYLDKYKFPDNSMVITEELIMDKTNTHALRFLTMLQKITPDEESIALLEDLNKTFGDKLNLDLLQEIKELRAKMKPADITKTT